MSNWLNCEPWKSSVYICVLCFSRVSLSAAHYAWVGTRLRSQRKHVFILPAAAAYGTEGKRVLHALRDLGEKKEKNSDLTSIVQPEYNPRAKYARRMCFIRCIRRATVCPWGSPCSSSSSRGRVQTGLSADWVVLWSRHMTARVPYSLSVVRNERMSLKARPRSVVSLVGFCRDGGGLSGLSLRWSAAWNNMWDCCSGREQSGTLSWWITTGGSAFRDPRWRRDAPYNLWLAEMDFTLKNNLYLLRRTGDQFH